MISASINDVSSIKITKPRKQDLTLTEDSYVIHLIIRSKDGELNLALFADNENFLKVENA